MAAPGIEVLFNCVKSQISAPQDSIICVLHWQIVSSGFTCIGVGEKITRPTLKARMGLNFGKIPPLTMELAALERQKDKKDNYKSLDEFDFPQDHFTYYGKRKNDVGEESEMLPEGWNTTPNLYILRYKSTTTSDIFILKVLSVDNSLLVHFWKDGTDKVATMNVRTEDYTTGDFSSYKKPLNTVCDDADKMKAWGRAAQDDLEDTERDLMSGISTRALKRVNDLAKNFKKEIISEIKGPSSPKAGPSTRRRSTSREREEDPLRVPPRQNQRPRRGGNEPDNPFSIGRSDLDPFGAGPGMGGGGGMFFDPMRGGRGPRFGMDPSSGLPSSLPPGAIPPGARFDPFGPPGTHPGHRPDPDPDHEKPPGYDDMFM